MLEGSDSAQNIEEEVPEEPEHLMNPIKLKKTKMASEEIAERKRSKLVCCSQATVLLTGEF